MWGRLFIKPTWSKKVSFKAYSYIVPHNINALANCYFIFFLNLVSVMINYQTNLTKKVFYRTSPYIFSHNIIALTNFFFFSQTSCHDGQSSNQHGRKKYPTGPRNTYYPIIVMHQPIVCFFLFKLPWRLVIKPTWQKKYPTRPPHNINTLNNFLFFSQKHCEEDYLSNQHDRKMYPTRPTHI